VTSPITVRECRGLSEVGSPEAWDALRARGPASLCGSRGWLAAAFATTHERALPFLLAAEAATRLVGLLPLALHDRKTFPTLRFAGAPNNDLNDVLVLSGYERGATIAIVDALAGVAHRGWTLCLDDVDPDGQLAAAPDAGVLEWVRGEPAPTVDLRGDWTSAASGRRRRQWNRRLRRLRDHHVVEFQRIDGPAMVGKLPEFIRLREARRQATAREPDQPPIPFLEAVVHALAPTGTCAYMQMLVDGRPVASDLYLLDPPVATMWLRALDPEAQRYPCGHLLLRESAAAFAAEGFESLDLGRGDEPYKFVFGAERRSLLRARLRWNAAEAA
jgi:CelD/BcsL family acetyltransferase involved in cellulose biosynthesis